MKTFEINGKKVKMPTEWAELSFKQCVEVQRILSNYLANRQDRGLIVPLIAVMTGTSQEEIESNTVDLEGFEEVIDLNFLKGISGEMIDDLVSKGLDRITIEGKEYEIPMLTLSDSQYDAITLYSLRMKEATQLHLYQCATVLQPLVKGEYCPDRIREFMNVIENCSFLDILVLSRLITKRFIKDADLKSKRAVAASLPQN